MADKVRPITPQEIGKKQEETFPDAVFEAFNELIAAKASKDSVTIKQREVVDLMVSKGLKRREIFKRGWLNIEKVYQDAGWQVIYDRPGYNESYEAFFVFKRRKRT